MQLGILAKIMTKENLVSLCGSQSILEVHREGDHLHFHIFWIHSRANYIFPLMSFIWVWMDLVDWIPQSGNAQLMDFACIFLPQEVLSDMRKFNTGVVLMGPMWTYSHAGCKGLHSGRERVKMLLSSTPISTFHWKSVGSDLLCGFWGSIFWHSGVCNIWPIWHWCKNNCTVGV